MVLEHVDRLKNDRSQNMSESGRLYCIASPKLQVCTYKDMSEALLLPAELVKPRQMQGSYEGHHFWDAQGDMSAPPAYFPAPVVKPISSSPNLEVGEH